MITVVSAKAAFSAIGMGYLLLLITTATFVAVCLYFDHAPSTKSLDPKHIDITPIEGIAWTDWEKSYAENVVPADLTIEAEHTWWTATNYNFSTIPIEVTVTNVGKLTFQDFYVLILIEDDTGHIRGTGGDSPRVSATGERVTRSLFIFNAPEDLRGQELRVHIIPTIQQQTLVIGKPLLRFVRTFPSTQQRELPRILLFFFAFSTLPVGVFLPPPLRRHLEGWWRRKLENDSGVVILLIILSLLGSFVYWDIVCKVFCFL